MTKKPIRVFWSPLSERFYASRAYKEVMPGVVEITGERWDVTSDIADLVTRHHIVFEQEVPQPAEEAKV
jgi:hypothetical protein